MKKLKLTALSLGAKDILTRDQMKKVMGGGTCAATFTTPTTGGSGSVNFDHCETLNVVTNSNGTKTYTCYGTSRDSASGIAQDAGSGAHWCCDSCSSASWYNP